MFWWKAWGRAALFVCIVQFFFLTPSYTYAAEDSKVREGRIKAAVLYYLAKFIKWPEQAFKSSEDQIRLCLAGEDPLNKFVKRTVSSKQVSGRNLKIIFVDTKPPKVKVEECHILFIGESDSESRLKLLSKLKGKHALSVGVVDGFTQQGGLVQLFKEENKFRIRINLDNVHRANLEVSSELLQVAVIEGSQ